MPSPRFLVYDIDILALRMKRETRHAEDVTRDGNDHACTSANHEVAHGEGEAFWHTDGLRVVAEGILSFGYADRHFVQSPLRYTIHGFASLRGEFHPAGTIHLLGYLLDLHFYAILEVVDEFDIRRWMLFDGFQT